MRYQAPQGVVEHVDRKTSPPWLSTARGGSRSPTRALVQERNLHAPPQLGPVLANPRRQHDQAPSSHAGEMGAEGQ